MRKSSDEAHGQAGAYVRLALGMAIFGSGVPASKLVTEAFPALLAAGIRVALSLVILLPLLALYRRDDLPKLRGTGWLYPALAGFGGIFLYGVCSLYGLRLAPPAAAGVVRSTTPAVVAVASYLFLRERLGWDRALGIASVLLGMLAVEIGGQRRSGDGNILLGSLLMLLAVCGDASYTLLGKKAMERLRPLTVATVAGLGALACFLPFSLYQVVEFRASGPTAGNWLALAWLGAGVSVLAPLLWYRGLERVTTGTAAVFLGIMPVSAVSLSYVLTDASFSWSHLVGVVGVMLGVGCVCGGPVARLRSWMATRRHRQGTGGAARGTGAGAGSESQA